MTKDLHDRGYKRLFSNHTIFRQLIESFVNQPWVKELDFSQCERIDKTFINEAYRRRESDVIYKIRLKEEVIYVYILVEFQSTVQPFMVVRFLHYISSFYMDYINSHKNITKLPAIFPILLYNGDREWTATDELSQVVEGPRFDEYGVKLRYFKIAENEPGVDVLQEIGNIVSTLFLAEQHYNLETLLDSLVELFETEEDKQAVTLFLNWFAQLTRHGRIAEEDFEQMVDEYENVEEVKHMLRMFSEEKEERLLRQGREEGEKQGRKEGEKQGRKEGEKQGRKEGEKRGIVSTKQDMFIKILEHKFGEVSDVLTEMIQQVDEIDELDQWLNRALETPSLNDLWDEPSEENRADSDY